jgi:hypothetical protein
MSRAQALYLHACVALMTLTGVVFAVMKYFMRPADEFSVISHPTQPHILSVHVVIAPFLVFGFGWIFSDHIWPKLRWEGRKRASGIWSLTAILPMTLSGYLLQISTDDAMRRTMAVMHWVSAALFVVVYVAHLVTRPAAANGRSASGGDGVNVPSPT